MLSSHSQSLGHGFTNDEYIVYPAHGVGQITSIETQLVAGLELELFVIHFEKDKMDVKVPVKKALSSGMRKLANNSCVEKALNIVKGRSRVKRMMWSRRSQEYDAKINSGDLFALAEVVRDLYRSDRQADQSYSERQLYEAALLRMVKEVALVYQLSDSEAISLIESSLFKSEEANKELFHETLEKSL